MRARRTKTPSRVAVCDQELDFRFRNYSHPRSTRGLRCLLALSTARLTRASACLFYLTFTKSQLSAGCTRGSVHTSMRGKHVYTWRTSGIERIQSRWFRALAGKILDSTINSTHCSIQSPISILPLAEIDPRFWSSNTANHCVPLHRGQFCTIHTARFQIKQFLIRFLWECLFIRGE